MNTVMVVSLISGIVGGIVGVFFYVVYQKITQDDNILAKDFNWAEMLSKSTFTLHDLQKMYIASVTVGACATGELFGTLKHLQETLAFPIYQQLEILHGKFSVSLRIMYNFREKQDHRHFQNARIDALDAFRRMEEIKTEFEIKKEGEEDQQPVIIPPVIYS